VSLPVNAVAMAVEHGPLPAALPQYPPDGGQIPRPEAESTLGIEEMQIRAETLTRLLEDILSSEASLSWRKQ
jgi:hypothetical protein